MTMKEAAVAYLREALGDTSAEFRPGQWESIELLLDRRRLLVVERTGWGKSMVYFIATRLTRDRGDGMTILISPLLSLMRNQIEAATRIGIRAASINGTMGEEARARVVDQVDSDSLDILLVSPEQLGKDAFRSEVLINIADRIGLFVVDEAHCISDWGHDFRPDYRRIVRVLQLFPSNVPVLATTATANDRVVADIMEQVGSGIELVRGALVRESLMLQNITMPSPAARMAWLSEMIPRMPGAGIVYTLTKRDADRVAEWLRISGIVALAYHKDVLPGEHGKSVLAPELVRRGLSPSDFDMLKADARATIYKEALEQALINNAVRVLVSTVALGMGFDKPDLGFVVHYQRPSSVVHYYQQVGRAGRAVDQAYGILFHGEEDEQIADYFIRNAFPPQRHVTEILDKLHASSSGLSIPQLQQVVNLTKSQVEGTLRFLAVESPSPVAKIGTSWHLTPAAAAYTINTALIEAIGQIRRDEQQQMRDYMAQTGCLMEFLGRALNDSSARPCGRCAGCNGAPLLSTEADSGIANRAAIFLKRSYQVLVPKKRFRSTKDVALRESGFTDYNIPTSLRASEGRALSLWRDAGWGQLVAAGKYQNCHFSDELVVACRDMLAVWSPEETPTWVTCIPSLKHPVLVPNFAQRLAAAIDLPFRDAISKAKDNRQQKFMHNSFQQARNLDGAFAIQDVGLLDGPCILIDDMTDSGWTFAVAAALLRRAGVSAVLPLALALNSPRMD